MSRTMAFGRDALATDVDVEDLLSALSADDVESLLDEMASDPDDKHLPASVRNSYKCAKAPSGPLNRDSLITHINEEGKQLKSPDLLLCFVVVVVVVVCYPFGGACYFASL
jgi:hypothetical protein